MTIIDAIKSDRPFRRNGWDKWFGPDVDYRYQPRWLQRDDILADDWEIMPAPPKPREWTLLLEPDGRFVACGAGNAQDLLTTGYQNVLVREVID